MKHQAALKAAESHVKNMLLRQGKAEQQADRNRLEQHACASHIRSLEREIQRLHTLLANQKQVMIWPDKES